ALALFGATIPLLGGLRVLTRTGGLARCLPFSAASIKLASVTVPAIVVAGWALATTPAYLGFGEGAVDRTIPDAFLMSVATSAAGLLGAIRWTQAKGVDFGAPMISTQAGAFPPGLMTNLFRGFDVCLLITAPMLLGFSPFWSLIIAAIAAMILLNSMDAETLRAKQAEQQKVLAAQKKQREADALAAKQRKR
nr:ABC transporter permease [Propionibacteriaceae bacterium]